MIFNKKMTLVFWLILCPMTIMLMERTITEAQRIRNIVNDDARWNALSEEQKFDYLTQLYLAEEKEAEEAKIKAEKQEHERREKEIAERERRIAEQKKAEAETKRASELRASLEAQKQEQEARKQLEMKARQDAEAREKKRAEQEAQQKAQEESKRQSELSTKRKMEEEARGKREEGLALAKARSELEKGITIQKMVEEILTSFKNEGQFPIEYYCTQVLQELYDRVDQITTEESLELAKKLGVDNPVMNEIVAKVRNAFQVELKKRKANHATNLKTLLKTPDTHDINLLTFKDVLLKLDAIQRLRNDAVQKECWAHELGIKLEKLEQILDNLDLHLQEIKGKVDIIVKQDMKKIEQEIAQEKASRDQAIALLKARKELQTYLLIVDEVKKTYPAFFIGIPENLEIPYLKIFEELYGDGSKDLNRILTKLYDKPDTTEPELIALGAAMGLNSYVTHGYAFFDHGKPFQVTTIKLPEYLNKQIKFGLLTPDQKAARLPELEKAAQDMVKNYKVHLMPDKKLGPREILVQIYQALKNDPVLAPMVTTFKIIVGNYEQPTRQGSPIIFPRVVFYVEGKENAQKLVDALYKNPILKNMKGLNQRPRFNGRVNDLIWIAQGDGDTKGNPDYVKYYERPGFIYYRGDVTGSERDQQGRLINYHLVHPETKQEIMS